RSVAVALVTSSARRSRRRRSRSSVGENAAVPLAWARRSGRAGGGGGAPRAREGRNAPAPRRIVARDPADLARPAARALEIPRAASALPVRAPEPSAKPRPARLATVVAPPSAGSRAPVPPARSGRDAQR